jgi:hypothetical protein
MALQSIKYHNGKLDILDQLLLPAQSKYVSVKGVEDGWKVINKMQVSQNNRFVFFRILMRNYFVKDFSFILFHYFGHCVFLRF